MCLLLLRLSKLYIKVREVPGGRSCVIAVPIGRASITDIWRWGIEGTTSTMIGNTGPTGLTHGSCPVAEPFTTVKQAHPLHPF
ncbi:MAG: hypothetical protein ACI95S_000102 [Dinoroseobacter sp.]